MSSNICGDMNMIKYAIATH